MVNNLYRLIYPDFIRTAQVASGGASQRIGGRLAY